MGSAIFAGLALSLILLEFVLTHRRRRTVFRRTAEQWAETLQHAEAALAPYQREVVPIRCVLVTGYAVADAAAAAALVEWVQRETGEQTVHWAESDPTFGPYWVVETRTGFLPVSSRLAARWVARMRLTCEDAACRLHHYEAVFGDVPPAKEGAPTCGG